MVGMPTFNEDVIDDMVVKLDGTFRAGR